MNIQCPERIWHPHIGSVKQCQKRAGHGGAHGTADADDITAIEVSRRLDERRNDTEFLKRLRDRIEDDKTKTILDRLRP